MKRFITLILSLVVFTGNMWANEVGKPFVQTGHVGSINSVAFSPDGKYLLSGGADKTITLWQSTNGKEIRKFEGHSERVNSVSFSPNGQYIASCSDDKTIKLWDITSGKEIKSFESDFIVKTIAFSPDGQYLAIGQNKMIDLLVLQSKKIIKNFRSCDSDVKNIDFFMPNGKGNWIPAETVDNKPHDVVSLVFSSDSKTMVCGSMDGTIKILNMEENVEPINLSIEDNYSAVTSIAFSHDNKTIVAGRGDGNIILFDLKNETARFTKAHEFHVSSVTFSPDGKYLATCSEDKTMKLWEMKVNKGVLVRRIPLTVVQSIAFSPDGKYLAMGEKDKLIELLDIENDMIVLSFKGHGTRKRIVSFDNQSDTIISTNNNDETDFWDFLNGQKIKTIKGSVVKSHTASYDHNKDRSIIASGSFSKDIQLWDNLDKKEINKLIGHSDEINFVFYSNDYKKIISGGFDKTIKIWDAQSGQEVKTLNGHTSPVISADMSANNEKIVSSSMDGTIKLWNLENNKELATFISLPFNEWIIITPEGYFNSSPKGYEALNILIDPMTVTDMSVFYDIFYRPDLVKLKLAGVDISSYTGNMTFQEAIKNPPPKVKIMQVDGKQVDESITLSKNKTKLSFKVGESNGGGVGLIRIYQEGKLIKTIGEGTVNRQAANADEMLAQEKINTKSKIEQQQLLAMNDKLSKSATIPLSLEESVAQVKTTDETNKAGEYTIDLNLIGGKNTITIEAFNKTNTILSLRESIDITSSLPKQKPVLHAIILGVNQFQANWATTLKYSENDAKDINAAIQNARNMGIFAEIKTHILLGENVTKEKLLATIDNVKKEAKLEDSIVLYISTHGRSLNGKLYLVSYDNVTVPNLIDFEETFKIIQSIPALNQIFVLDTCESGQANDIVSSVYDAKASVLAKRSGVHMLLATTKGTSAFESQDPKIKNGVFTHKILSSLKDAKTDLNHDGFMSVIEISSILKSAAVGTAQYPIIRNVGSDVLINKVK